MHELMHHHEWFSLEFAKKLDELDPLAYTSKLFNIGELIPFAGHSLGPSFQPALEKIEATAQLQKKLHEGSLPNPEYEEIEIGNWFDCDRYPSSLNAAKQLLGFEDDTEFTFTASGLSQNLGMLMEAFYRPSKQDWHSGKTKIVMLETEFFSDQAVAVSILKRAIQIADGFECFNPSEKPTAESHMIKIKPDERGLFSGDNIIKLIKENASQIQMICLSDIVFGTGQRLPLTKIFGALQTIIKDNNIIVGLDLAHTVGNRMIDLKSLPVTFAVGCGYKHLTGFSGSGFGFYVNKNADLKKFPPLQGWKAADSNAVFATINHYDESIMTHTGALAFRMSNPSPLALIPVQSFLSYFNKIGFHKCFNRSECITRYLIALLKHTLGDKIEFITPEDPAERGAMIVFRTADQTDVKMIEEFLKNEKINLGKYEIDVRPPNNIRLTAHYAYTSFEQINGLARKLVIGLSN